MMQNPFHAISPFSDKSKNGIHVLLEISLHERVKYEFNKTYGVIMVDRILNTPMPYPFNYGLIPQTWNEFDDDPLDVILLGDEKFSPGTMIPCRVIGILSVDDNGERDDKILAVTEGDPKLTHIHEITDVDPKTIENMIYFLEHYKDLEKKTVTVKGQGSSSEALEFIRECTEVYRKKFSS
jgi:inorganic pyrophosphatase